MICPTCHRPVKEGVRRRLTRRQRDIYAFCAAYQDRYGAFPSFAEIAKHISVTSLATIHEHMQNLVLAGWLTRIDDGVQQPYALPAWASSVMAATR